MTKIRLRLLVVALSLSTSAAIAQDDPSQQALRLDDQTFLSLVAQARVDAAQQISPLEMLTPCYAGAISCGQTVTGRVSVDSCVTSDSVYGVGYLFNGTMGQRVTLRSSSPSYRMGMALFDGRTGNDTLYATVQATVNGGTAEISNFQLPYTGPYTIILSPLVRVTFGDYSLTVTCVSGSASCTPSSTVLCLNNSRFRVDGTFRTPTGQTGPVMAQTVPTAPDSGLFWFFSANNLEMLVKVLNGCALNSRYWVFFSAGTNVEFTVNVTDTLRGGTRTYSNPLNNPAAPVQDTSAFATCP
jgi:hypothetical protein